MGCSRDRDWTSLLGEVIAQTSALVAPRRCPCGQEGTWLCGSCTVLLHAEPRRVDALCDALQVLTAARVREERHEGHLLPSGVDHTPLLPVLALGEYGGDLQRLVLAWKNGGMLHLGARIAPALTPAVTRLADAAGVASPGLVPVPSRRSARLRRGEDHTAELVRAMQRDGAGRALLLRARPTTAQEGQGARQRRARRIRVEGRRAREAGGRAEPVVIVDDVVTTGSTLRGMHEALTRAGMDVLGAVVVAAARLPPTWAEGGGRSEREEERAGNIQ
jgi:predicted amidophosphoribosyltransferase